MKRLLCGLIRPRYIIASIALGIATTYAIAIACAAWSPAHRSRGVDRAFSEKLITWRFGTADPAATVRASRAGIGFGVAWWFLYEERNLPELGGPVDDIAAMSIRAGWPMYALERRERRQTFDLNVPPSTVPVDAISSTQRGLQQEVHGRLTIQPHARPLPFAPIWPGFAVNAMAWTAGWFLVLMVLPLLAAVRRRWRCGHDRCGHCGYDLRGHDSIHACPECGSA